MRNRLESREDTGKEPYRAGRLREVDKQCGRVWRVSSVAGHSVLKKHGIL
jgi:hypothetical protein